MGKVNTLPDELVRIIRRELRKEGWTCLKNRKTGTIYFRRLTTNPAPPLTEQQEANKQNFSNLSHQASQWIKDNGPKACPPNGTPEYQRISRSFNRQKTYKRLLNFVMFKLQHNLITNK